MIDIDKFVKKSIGCEKCMYYISNECRNEPERECIMDCLYDTCFDIVVDFQKEFCYEIHKQICAGISLSELDRELTDIVDF